MNCDNCEVALNWDGLTPVVVCEICRSYRFVDVPDDTAGRIVCLNDTGRLNCPRCRRRMLQAATEGLRIERCVDCDGMVMADDVFAMFVRNRRSEFRQAAIRPVLRINRLSPNGIHCPSCRRQMNGHPFYGPNFVTMESCSPCGIVWVNCNVADICVTQQKSVTPMRVLESA